LDALNFEDLAEATVIANVQENCDAFLDVWNERGEQVRDEYFALENHRLVLKKAVVPAMLTLNTKIVRQDCLCYLMERLSSVADLAL
jgi:hypothetical protein